MKQYPTIMSYKKSPRSHCIAFNKYDGSNIRCEWTKKAGWKKFGSKKCLIDRTTPVLGEAIDVFLNTYAEDLDNIFRKDKYLKEYREITVFCEFFGENSFAGQHDLNDKKEIILIDVSIHKKGFIPASKFVKIFGEIKIPEIIYEGNFSNQFIQDVKDGIFNVKEGVVAKGQYPRGKPPHNLWMAKVKTNKWLDELRQKALEEPLKYGTIINENEKEQNGN